MLSNFWRILAYFWGKKAFFAVPDELLANFPANACFGELANLANIGINKLEGFTCLEKLPLLPIITKITP
jgi:hypothetical protein